MNLVTNEYIHELFTNFNVESGHCLITYEPLQRIQVLSLQGTIYIDGEESHPFWWSRGRGEINWHDDHLLIRYGNLDPITGLIHLEWKNHPPEHFLCVSYHFCDIPLVEAKSSVNWLKEGF